MDSLSRLFGSLARVKLLRLFLFNDAAFTPAEAALRTKLTREVARKEINALTAASVLKKRAGKEARYGVNKTYKHLAALEEFLRTTDGIADKRFLTAFRKLGTLRLVALSGFFTATPESKIDLLVVGDHLSEKAFARAVGELEAELGREINYAVFSTEDFRYRVGVYDRLIRDVFDYPHRLLLDKIGL